MSVLLSAFYYCYFFVTAALLFIAQALISPLVLLFDRKKKLFHFLTSLWGYHLVKLNPFWNCSIEGAQFIEEGKSYVIVANHQSLADVFVLSGIRHNFKWVSKESLLRIPFFGWNMRLNDYIALKRGDSRSIKSMMANCKQWLSKGVSIMMFPEGTRSETGELGNFRDGSFRLALACNVPIVPIVISGTNDVISKRSLKFNFSGRMKIKVLAPVLPETFKGSTSKMRDYVHDLMENNLGLLKQEQ
ncbi:MAG: 1-acyl-sn-glycerol-3-phosphate acyltransferase [Candidatus Obscuribacterales bacterium]|nr:1-acyl-sn-glycerol-3-phosphate acyltransferase [Candidatus Obscuribacterales bacterium]